MRFGRVKHDKSQGLASVPLPRKPPVRSCRGFSFFPSPQAVKDPVRLSGFIGGMRRHKHSYVEMQTRPANSIRQPRAHLSAIESLLRFEPRRTGGAYPNRPSNTLIYYRLHSRSSVLGSRACYVCYSQYRGFCTIYKKIT